MIKTECKIKAIDLYERDSGVLTCDIHALDLVNPGVLTCCYQLCELIDWLHYQQQYRLRNSLTLLVLVRISNMLLYNGYN